LKTSFYYKQKSILIKIIKEMTKMADNPVISKVKVNGTTYDIKSSEASHSTTADSATTATNAGHATNADSATNATNATNANHATTADSATSATTATTLKDTRVIDGINFNGSGDVRHYASCATASGTGT
jgi:glucan-binding YG repeat protein